jgi:hypothetical protein
MLVLPLVEPVRHGLWKSDVIANWLSLRTRFNY